MPSPFRPLRHRQFALFWTGAFVSNIGTWMETVAIGSYVASITGQAFWLGVIAAAGFVPTAILGPLGGALADRLDRRRLLLSTTSVQTVCAGILCALAAVGHPSPAVIAVVMFGAGCAAAIGFPAYQSTIPDLVEPDDLVAAIALGSAQWNLGRIIGPAIAGLVIAAAGTGAALAVNTASFFAVIGALLLITLPPPRRGASDASIRAAVVEGARFVRTEPGLRVAFLLLCLNTFVAAPFIALIPSMATGPLDRSEAATSVLVTAQGIGAVAAALGLGTLTARFGQRSVVITAMAVLGPALVLYGQAPGLLASAAALVVVGAAYLGSLASFSSITQHRSPAHLRGRAMSLNTMVLGLLYPIGAVAQGALADRIGLRRVTSGSGVLLAVGLAGVLSATNRARAIDRPAAEPVAA